ncbi:MAG: DUF2141 domain-containing protein [Flavobacterium sp.]
MSIIYVISLSLLFSLPYAEFVSQEFSLEVKIVGFKPSKGILRVCLFNSENTFFNNAMACEVKETSSNEQSITLRFSKKIPAGKYAIAVYQDINKNGILDRNWLGIPSEPYGFSNNPSTIFGPPSFHKAAFKMKDNLTITIKL